MFLFFFSTLPPPSHQRDQKQQRVLGRTFALNALSRRTQNRPRNLIRWRRGMRVTSLPFIRGRLPFTCLRLLERVINGERTLTSLRARQRQSRPS